ncbi:MAG: type IX secretion system membrane protein PorP/SprF [Bacteroidetes bacterium]|nr:type IX secretion system membrane protein PorP/SprF [Bacteroidota bacterium]
MKTIHIKTLTLISFVMLFATKGKAQYDAMFTQYMFNEMFINPAYAGSKDAMNVTLLHRQQWVSFAGRPITTSFSLHGPLMDNNMGVGLSILNEKVGIQTRNLIYGSYAYRLKAGDNGKLALGLMGGVENQINRFGQIKVNDVGPDDPQFAQNSPNIIAPNFGFGTYYSTKTFYVGLSVPRLVDNNLKLSSGNAVSKTSRIEFSKFTYYITGGNVFTLNEDLKLKANGMIKLVQNAPVQLDLGASAIYQDMFFGGLSFRTGSAVSVLLGIQANKQLFISYAYDFGINKIQRYSLGSHELVINYLFAYKSNKITSARYF